MFITLENDKLIQTLYIISLKKKILADFLQRITCTYFFLNRM